MPRLPDFMRTIRGDCSGLAMTEFALAFPFILGVGLMGLEVANRALVEMQVSQLAMQIADNGSRIGETDVLENRKIYEQDINDLFYGAHLQSGGGVDLLAHGRVIMSSLQYDAATGGNYIAWQRCIGSKVAASSYGDENSAQSEFAGGMGPLGTKVEAFEDTAVIFVEISYTYQPLVGEPFTFGRQEVQAIASYMVRDDRDLSGIYQRNASNPDPVADCDTFGGSHYQTTSSGSTSSTSSGSTTTTGGTTTTTSSGTSTSTSSSGGSGTSGTTTSGGATSGGATSSGASSSGSSGGTTGGRPVI